MKGLSLKQRLEHRSRQPSYWGKHRKALLKTLALMRRLDKPQYFGPAWQRIHWAVLQGDEREKARLGERHREVARMGLFGGVGNDLMLKFDPKPEKRAEPVSQDVLPYEKPKKATSVPKKRAFRGGTVVPEK